MFRMPWPQWKLKRRKTKKKNSGDQDCWKREEVKRDAIDNLSLQSFWLSAKEKETKNWKKNKSQPVNNFGIEFFSRLFFGLLFKKIKIKSSASLPWQKLPIKQLKDVQLK